MIVLLVGHRLRLMIPFGPFISKSEQLLIVMSDANETLKELASVLESKAASVRRAPTPWLSRPRSGCHLKRYIFARAFDPRIRLIFRPLFAGSSRRVLIQIAFWRSINQKRLNISDLELLNEVGWSSPPVSYHLCAVISLVNHWCIVSSDFVEILSCGPNLLEKMTLHARLQS